MSCIDLESKILKLQDEIVDLSMEKRKMKENKNLWRHCPFWLRDECNDYEHCHECLIARIGADIPILIYLTAHPLEQEEPR